MPSKYKEGDEVVYLNDGKVYRIDDIPYTGVYRLTSPGAFVDMVSEAQLSPHPPEPPKSREERRRSRGK